MGIALTVGLVLALGSAVNQAVNPNSTAPSAAAPSITEQAPSQVPTSPVPAGPETLAVGDSAVITQNGVTAATLTITKVDVSSVPVDQYQSGPANGYFVTAHVKFTVEPSFTEGFAVNSLDFYALVSSQHFQSENGNSTFLNSALQPITLAAGESTTGTVMWDLPSAHAKIAYAPNLDGSPLAYWQY